MDFAAPFVAGVLARIVCNETDTAKMERAVDAVTRVAKTGAPETYFEMAMVGSEYLADRHEYGSETHDVLWAITEGTVLGGRKLTDDEQLGVLTVQFLTLAARSA